MLRHLDVSVVGAGRAGAQAALTLRKLIREASARNHYTPSRVDSNARCPCGGALEARMEYDQQQDSGRENPESGVRHFILGAAPGEGRRLDSEAGLDLVRIKGSGRRGRIIIGSLGSTTADFAQSVWRRLEQPKGTDFIREFGTLKSHFTTTLAVSD
jgi:hypothetical protein